MKAAALNAQSGNGGKGPVVVQPPTPTQNNNDPNSPLNKVGERARRALVRADGGGPARHCTNLGLNTCASVPSPLTPHP